MHEGKAATISHISSPSGAAWIPGGHKGERQVGSSRGWGLVRLGREGPVAAREGEAFSLVKSWLPLAKEQI